MQITKRKLGNTTIEITSIGLGCWQFSEGEQFAKFIWDTVPDDERNAIVAASLQGGINWFDTAESYGGGHSERGLARALLACQTDPEEVVIATKWRPFLRTAGSIKKTFSDRIENLAPYKVDLHQVHLPFSFSSPEAEMDAMADLLDAGLIRAVGVSNFSATRMRRAHNQLVSRGYSLASNQVKYNLLDRRIESNGVLETAQELGITIIAYSPLEQGLLTGRFHDDPDKIRSLPLARRLSFRNRIDQSRMLLDTLGGIADRYKVSRAQVALNWVVNSHGDTVVAIPGASKVRQARENAGVLTFQLNTDEMTLLDEGSQQFR
jgi:aryl-alcohol dehydrogenase-like predicted oxidoreductase